MSFRLVDTGWDSVFSDAVLADQSCLRLICPFIKKSSVERLLANGSPGSLLVITRFSLDDFAKGVSDLSALNLLLENGAAIRGIKNLHAKLYLFGKKRAIVTSANLTEAAMLRNHEFGFVADNSNIVEGCEQYFAKLWVKAGSDLTRERLAQWEEKVTAYLAIGANPSQSGNLGDEGVDVGIEADTAEVPACFVESKQSFVKFFGKERAIRSLPILQEIDSSGSHWACAYPKGRRPRQVYDGATMFVSRLVEDPADVLIYGRAIGIRHIVGRDDATPEDIERREWKNRWPHYVRVHHAEFIAGTLVNAVSLHELMDKFESDAFVATKWNAQKGTGNTNPRLAYRQQPSVELTPEATIWLHQKLQCSFDRFGKVPAADLMTLDWPTITMPSPTTN